MPYDTPNQTIERVIGALPSTTTKGLLNPVVASLYPSTEAGDWVLTVNHEGVDLVEPRWYSSWEAGAQACCAERHESDPPVWGMNWGSSDEPHTECEAREVVADLLGLDPDEVSLIESRERNGQVVLRLRGSESYEEVTQYTDPNVAFRLPEKLQEEEPVERLKRDALGCYYGSVVALRVKLAEVGGGIFLDGSGQPVLVPSEVWPSKGQPHADTLDSVEAWCDYLGGLVVQAPLPTEANGWDATVRYVYHARPEAYEVRPHEDGRPWVVRVLDEDPDGLRCEWPDNCEGWIDLDTVEEGATEAEWLTQEAEWNAHTPGQDGWTDSPKEA